MAYQLTHATKYRHKFLQPHSTKHPIVSTPGTSSHSPAINNVPAAAPHAYSGSNEVFAFVVAGLVRGVAFGL
ncbi:unnamed protein product [Diplocarpon coronariae]